MEAFLFLHKDTGLLRVGDDELKDAYEDVTAGLPGFIDDVYNARRLHSSLGYLSPVQYEIHSARHPVKTVA